MNNQQIIALLTAIRETANDVADYAEVALGGLEESAHPIYSMSEIQTGMERLQKLAFHYGVALKCRDMMQEIKAHESAQRRVVGCDEMGVVYG